jgi:hypothetical protein
MYGSQFTELPDYLMRRLYFSSLKQSVDISGEFHSTLLMCRSEKLFKTGRGNLH